VVSSTPRLHFTPGKDTVPILQGAGWAPGPVWIPDRLDRSSVAIATELPGPLIIYYYNKIKRVRCLEYIACVEQKTNAYKFQNRREI